MKVHGIIQAATGCHIAPTHLASYRSVTGLPNPKPRPNNTRGVCVN